MLSKTTATLAGSFLTGILLTGIGTGIAATEYLSFEVERISIGTTDELVTETITYEMAPDQLIAISNPNCTVEFDKSVTQGTVQMQIEYLPDLSYIDFWADTYVKQSDGATEDGQEVTLLHLYTYNHSSSTIFFEHKDEILEGLKDKKLLVYDAYFNGDNSVKTIKLNPTDESRLVEDPHFLDGGWVYQY